MPAIDIAATFHENKRPKKTFSENQIKSDLNVAGTLDAAGDTLRMILEVTPDTTIILNIERYYLT